MTNIYYYEDQNCPLTKAYMIFGFPGDASSARVN